MIKNMNEILSAASKASKKQLEGYSFHQKEVELTGDENLLAEETGWAKQVSKPYSSKKIINWNMRDFLSYCFSQYKGLTGQPWPISYRAAQEGLKLMQEQLKAYFGEWPSNRLTKLYIDWFFKEQAEALIGKYNLISFKMLRYEANINEFFQFCREQNINFRTQEKSHNLPKEFTDESVMKQCMEKGITDFICKYGIFICYQWLKKDKYNKKMSITKISNAIRDLGASQSIDKLFELTETSGPYPLDMKKEFSELTRELALSTGEPFTLISVEYTNEQRYPFFE